MRVRVRVRDHTLTINVGQGSQRLKWLAVISLQRYEETIGEDSGEKTFSSAHVATGIMDAAGTLLYIGEAKEGDYGYDVHELTAFVRRWCRAHRSAQKAAAEGCAEERRVGSRR